MPARRRALGVAVVVLLTSLGLLPAGPAGAAPGGGRPAAAPAEGFDRPGIPVGPASERYVRETYASILGRDIDPGGLAYWGDRLDGGTNRNTFARLIVLSEEAVRRQVRSLYQIFGRDPSTSELDERTAAIRAGRTTPEAVLVQLLASNEYFESQAGGTDAGYVAALYEDVLGRPGDPSGSAYWEGRLSSGATRTTVARGFVYARDRMAGLVDAGYDQVLARTADSDGRAFWIDWLHTGGRSVLLLTQSLLASTEAWEMGCSALDTGRCLLPFPNDEMTVADPSTDTGRRVLLKPSWVPRPANGTTFDPREWNRQDGFSPGSALLVAARGIDPGESGAPPITDVGASLAPDSPVVVVDTETGERWPIWVELDSHADSVEDQALVIRPARNFLDGRTYAVGIGPVVDSQGQAVEAPAGFRTYRDDLPSNDRRIDERRAAAEEAIDHVVDAGLDRESLYLAWTFTVASTRNLAERIVHMRDETLDGPAEEGQAPFAVTNVSPNGDGTTRVDGTFEVPNYLTGTGQAGSRLRLGSDHLPEAQGTYTAPFTCTVPDSAAEEPARAALYGHGLLGTGSQASSGYVRLVSIAENITFCGTDWIGMSSSDLGNTISILGNLSRFPELADRTQQGLLNFVVLGRLLTQPGGLTSHAAFQDGSGEPAVDGGDLTYYGLSQGGIMGGALVPISPDITRGVLGVPGMNYSTLLERSVDFDPFFLVLAPSYPSALDRILLISTIQMLWDRGEANGYANHVTSDPLPGSPVSEVVLQVAFGDHQVAQVSADVMARTYGAATNDPPLAPGRVDDVEPLWGIPRIEAYPYDGSATIYFDSGTPAPPHENVPPREGSDPHSDPRFDPGVIRQIGEFLQPGGQVIDVCEGTFCTVAPRG